MGDYESRIFDVEMDFSSLCDRINRRDPTLCDEDWCGITNNFDLRWIEAVYKNIKVDNMFDVVTELICRQYSTMVIKGQIDDPFPHVNESGMVIDYPEYYLNKFRDEIRSQRAAEELERKTRIKLKQKMKAMNKDAYNTPPTVIESKMITEEMVKQIDWVEKTHNFDLDAIRDIVDNMGNTPREKKIIIQAIYDAETDTGEVYKIPYGVDKLLNDLYKKYDEKHKGFLKAYDPRREGLNLDILMEQKFEEMMKENIATEADIDEIFAEEPKQVENQGTEGEGNHDDNLSSLDKQIKTAVEIMKKEKVIKHLYDYAYIMMIMNETKDLPTFKSPKSFLDYFKDLRIIDMPGEDSIKKKVNATFDHHPSWIFTDTKGKDANEAKRRNAIGSRFLSIYRKGK